MRSHPPFIILTTITITLFSLVRPCTSFFLGASSLSNKAKSLLLLPPAISSVRSFRLLSSSSSDSSSTSFMAQIPKISYIEPTELREHIELIKEDKDGAKTIAVIDVRDEDFEGGMLPFARNVPSEEWYNDDLIDQLVAQFRSKDMVVFHCMQSQQRGPFCARRFLARLTVALEGAEGTSFPDIRVLRGGFGTWRAMYGSDKTLVVPITSSNT